MARIVDKAAKRQQLVRAAARVFAQQGFSNTSMASVAQAAAVSKGSLYDYFDSKEALFQAVFADYASSLMAQLAPALTAASPLEQLQALINGAVEQLQADLSLYPLTLEFWACAGSGTQRQIFRDAMARFYQAMRNLLTDVIERGQQAGQFRHAGDASAMATIIVAALDGLMLQYWLAPDLPLDVLKARFLDHLIRGME
ncbi:MAG: TetR/AcrR family transcriptional regulator [Alcanivorax sp.]|nr:TetR/AcrR family transcriptional regulator [Alcanivorax sp.]